MELSFNGNEIDLPKIITIKMLDKIRIRRMINKETENFHIMITQGITWYNLETEIETVSTYKHFILDKTWHAYSSQSATSCMASSGPNSE